MKNFVLYFLITISFYSFAQNNVTLLSNLNQYSSSGYNDIWGYADGSGNEFALLGVRTGTSIINVTNPENPVEVAFIPGTFSTWRDIKTWGTYAYVVSDYTSDGLQIIDLSQLPTTATLVNQITTWFERSHNIFIDNGFAYAVGTEGGGGIHIIDLSNPVNPTQTAYYTTSGYVHDVYVWNDTIVACAGSSEQYHLINVSNKSNPQLISISQTLPGIYAHSGWMTQDKRYFLACEEFNVRDLTVWDLQDRSSWDLVVSTWQMPTGSSIIHNCFVRGNYVHISYYTSGYVVLDVTNPTNPQLAGQYDTYPSSNGGTYDGAWGCYPYLPSGNVLVSDIESGLYVVHFDGEVPVELSSFTAQATGNSVILNWATATETNNQGFEVQRKSDSEFYTIGFVSGQGTTTESQNYSYTDRNLDNGTYEYRLKQTDFDGSFHYSETVNTEIFYASSFELKQNYPNPFNPSTTIRYTVPKNEFVNLSVYNLLGEKVAELVNEVKNAGEYKVNFTADGVTSGIYFAKISAGDFTQSIKMSLLK
jgi:choice-of-anchor B domain-containing protein